MVRNRKKRKIKNKRDGVICTPRAQQGRVPNYLISRNVKEYCFGNIQNVLIVLFTKKLIMKMSQISFENTFYLLVLIMLYNRKGG